MPSIPFLQIITYSFAVWFGLYLLRRRFNKPGMRYTGFGLLAYATGLAIDILLSPSLSPGSAAVLTQERFFVAFLPLIFWFAAVRNLFSPGALQGLPKLPLRLIIIGSIFFGLSISMLVLPQAWFTSDIVVLGVGLDLAILSYGIATLDAHDEGEVLPRDFLRSLGASFLLAILFGGQVVLAMAVGSRAGPIMLLLLLAVITSAILVQVFYELIQSLLDRLLFPTWPRLQQERENLWAVASVLPRVNESMEFDHLSEEEFIRLTRRALSHMGDLKRLAASPLTRLPLVTARLSTRGQPDGTLDRAAELKTLLTESITRLKPQYDSDFGITDEWRYYNVLYYPYVLGIRPFSQRFTYRNDDALQAVMEWFRVQVPERTLHNWQNTAAGLVAKDLRERSG